MLLVQHKHGRRGIQPKFLSRPFKFFTEWRRDRLLRYWHARMPRVRPSTYRTAAAVQIHNIADDGELSTAVAVKASNTEKRKYINETWNTFQTDFRQDDSKPSTAIAAQALDIAISIK